MGFEPTIPASERAKTVHALDCAATVTGSAEQQGPKYSFLRYLEWFRSNLTGLYWRRSNWFALVPHPVQQLCAIKLNFCQRVTSLVIVTDTLHAVTSPLFLPVSFECDAIDPPVLLSLQPHCSSDNSHAFAIFLPTWSLFPNPKTTFGYRVSGSESYTVSGTSLRLLRRQQIVTSSLESWW
jgi:hypothetical protein